MAAIQLNLLYGTATDCILHYWSETDFRIYDWNAFDYLCVGSAYVNLYKLHSNYKIGLLICHSHIELWLPINFFVKVNIKVKLR